MSKMPNISRDDLNDKQRAKYDSYGTDEERNKYLLRIEAARKGAETKRLKALAAQTATEPEDTGSIGEGGDLESQLDQVLEPEVIIEPEPTPATAPKPNISATKESVSGWNGNGGETGSFEINPDDGPPDEEPVEIPANKTVTAKDIERRRLTHRARIVRSDVQAHFTDPNRPWCRIAGMRGGWNRTALIGVTSEVADGILTGDSIEDFKRMLIGRVSDNHALQRVDTCPISSLGKDQCSDEFDLFLALGMNRSATDAVTNNNTDYIIECIRRQVARARQVDYDGQNIERGEQSAWVSRAGGGYGENHPVTKAILITMNANDARRLHDGDERAVNRYLDRLSDLAGRDGCLETGSFYTQKNKGFPSYTLLIRMNEPAITALCEDRKSMTKSVMHATATELRKVRDQIKR